MTDIVTDFDGMSHTVFICKGFALPLTMLRFGGLDITVKLVKILTEGTLSLLSQSGKLFQMSKRYCATCLYSTTHSTN